MKEEAEIFVLQDLDLEIKSQVKEFEEENGERGGIFNTYLFAVMACENCNCYAFASILLKK